MNPRGGPHRVTHHTYGDGGEKTSASDRMYTFSVTLLTATMAVWTATAAFAHPVSPPPGQATTTSVTQPAASAEPETRPSFADWLDEVRREALARGIREDIVERALADVSEPVPVVIERDRSQAETVLSIEDYVTRQLTTERLRTGRAMMARYKSTLDRIARTYGVPSRIIAAIWGMESNFGRFSGVRPTIAALATLAWDPRRGTYFRSELFDALSILNRGDVEVEQLKGSWAGAMGQPQFMPSSYLQFAVDFNGDGRRDIWSTPGDVFASIANYLRGHGWQPGLSWGREVSMTAAVASEIAAKVPRRDGTCRATRDMTAYLSTAEWQRMGVRTVGGGRLPASAHRAAIVSGSSRAFLVNENYDALLEYNCAHSYALSVALLGDRLVATPQRTAPRRRAPKRAAPRPGATPAR